jgi:ArsR family transcriptional regulator
VTAKLDRHAQQLGALGHPVRLTILRFVVQAGRDGSSAGEIQEHVDLPASTLSHHLKRLVEAGLFSTRTEANYLRRALRVPARPHRLPLGGLLQARRQRQVLLMTRCDTSGVVKARYRESAKAASRGKAS